jgi:alpha-1,3/alpha-1,6-mannosyltransferase
MYALSQFVPHCYFGLFYLAAGIFHDTFKSLSSIKPEVLYPIPDFSAFEKPVDETISDIIPSGASTVFLSINRYERKKNLPLALHAFSEDSFAICC